jgi:hypothetical protein
MTRTKSEQDFEFQNGTVVRAKSLNSALNILGSTKSINPKVQHLADQKWLVEFGQGVSRIIEAPTSSQAGQSAGWALYLDRREPVRKALAWPA